MVLACDQCYQIAQLIDRHIRMQYASAYTKYFIHVSWFNVNIKLTINSKFFGILELSPGREKHTNCSYVLGISFI